jgi:hypothetical protein
MTSPGNEQEHRVNTRKQKKERRKKGGIKEKKIESSCCGSKLSRHAQEVMRNQETSRRARLGTNQAQGSDKDEFHLGE